MTEQDEAEASNPSSQPGESPGFVAGLFQSVTRLASTLVVIAHTRLELLTTELQEEVQRAAGLLVWTFVALLASMLGLLFAACTIVIVYWDDHRVLAAVLVTAAFLGLAIVAVVVLLVKINSRRRFLDATLTELSKDAAALKDKL